jgi:ABC-type taurine transport system ATPase subunit
MSTSLSSVRIRGFKRFSEIDIPLANPVVFVGPNNSGKTSALQALALWSYGVRKWEDRRGTGKATRRTGVSINRRELTNIPLINSYALWRNLRVRRANTPVRIEIEVKGVYNGEEWVCGMEFDSVDQENIRCRPMHDKTSIPEGALQIKVAFLPPMSGLVSQEDLLQPGSIDRRIGEGRTADVLRNLCYRVFQQASEEQQPDTSAWRQLTDHIQRLFGVILNEPIYDRDTGVLSLQYSEQDNPQVMLDLNASGQGFRQTLLLLSYLYLNPDTLLLLDEPDAHLEILRQRQIYNTFSDISHRLNSQIIIATHSEVILDEAAQRDMVIAFVGKPHPVSKSAQVRKALAEYGYDHYLQAEQRGWVLYLEGATDYDVLRNLAQRLGHQAALDALQSPFVHHVANQPKKAQEHFYAMREAFPSLQAVALFDHLDRLPEEPNFPMLMWQRRELENYIAHPDAIRAFAVGRPSSLLEYDEAELTSRQTIIDRLIEDIIPRAAIRDWNDVYWVTTKVSDDVLPRLFEQFYSELGVPNDLHKSGFHRLVEHLPVELILPEVIEKLDAVAAAAARGSEQRRIWQKRRGNDDASVDDPVSG